MYASTARTKTAALTVVSLLCAIAILIALAGCSLFGKDEPSVRDVSEYGGLFHFQMPADWQSTADSTVIAVYAGDELPAENSALDSLSILVFTGPMAEDTDAEGLLAKFVADRAVGRGWTDAQISEPAVATVGGREGEVIEVAATDLNGVAFKGRFYMIRTSGKDVLINAVAPAERFDEFAPEIDKIMEHWYWHVPPSAEDTATAS